VVPSTPVTSSSNVAAISVSGSTSSAPSSGSVAITVGAVVSPGVVVSSAVVNVHDVSASGLPLASSIPEDSVAVYTVSGVRADVGVNVAVLDVLSYSTVPGTSFPAASVTVNESSLTPCTGSLNVAVISASVATSSAPSAGTLEVTVGAVVSLDGSPENISLNN
jgi:hypothetical protein